MSNINQYVLSLGDYLLHKSLKHLILHVTNNCNFRCKHCFIDFNHKRDLKLPVYQDLGRQVKKLFWLDIGGGEPFLRKDLSQIITAFPASVIGIPSNGSLPDLMEEQLIKIKEISDAEIVLSLSLDGLRDTHDDIRGQPGNWDQIWQTFERLQQLEGVSIKITTVITQQNFDKIIPLMQEVRRHKPDFHSVILLRGDTMDENTALPEISDLRKIAPSIFKILSTYDYGKNALSARILRNYHKYLWQTSLATIEQKTQIIPCLAGKAHRVVWGNGDVASCEMLPSVGNILKQSWQEIETSPAFIQQVQSIENKECACTHNCAMLDSIFFNPNQVAKLLLPI